MLRSRCESDTCTPSPSWMEGCIHCGTDGGTRGTRVGWAYCGVYTSLASSPGSLRPSFSRPGMVGRRETLGTRLIDHLTKCHRWLLTLPSAFVTE